MDGVVELRAIRLE